MMEGHFEENDIDQIYQRRTDYGFFLKEGTYSPEEEYPEEGYKARVRNTIDGKEVKVSSPEEEITTEVERDILEEESERLKSRSSELLPMPSVCHNPDDAITAYAIYALKSREIEGERIEVYEIDWNGVLDRNYSSGEDNFEECFI